MNATEFDELRRKVQMQTASRRYRKRKKEISRHKTMRLQRLQVELSRLQDREAQMKKYQQHSVESLQQELEMHQDEVANLSCKVEAATSSERDWITAMSKYLHK
ncbi:unnamed protein product [Hyaloperonospora brassicae]|uniref:BZIP domain-containing protein n=1 Tax=Hyaloperonospora brassicae TaxID=162125 RepID=A0AAV0V3F1_HYABA|nr:unnamed protein product [Hyaloperonospora brassicae]